MRSVGMAMIIALAAANASPAVEEAPSTTQQPQRRAAIAAERHAVQQRFDTRQRDCQQRFVVTSCLNAAQKERRDALAPLRQEELRIDTAERRQRAADRREEIDAKQRADAARDAAAAGAPAHSLLTEPPDHPANDRPARPMAGSAPRQSISAAERQRREEANVARFEANQIEAEKRREAVDARNAKRAASGKVERPLPLPSGASAPSTGGR